MFLLNSNEKQWVSWFSDLSTERKDRVIWNCSSKFFCRVSTMSVLKFAKIPKSAIKSNFNISHQIHILPKCLSYDIYICFIALYSYCISAIAPLMSFLICFKQICSRNFWYMWMRKDIYQCHISYITEISIISAMLTKLLV